MIGGYSTWAPWMKNLDNPVGHLNLYNRHVYQTDIMLNGYAEADLFVKGLKYRLNVGINRTLGRNYDRGDERPDGFPLFTSILILTITSIILKKNWYNKMIKDEEEYNLFIKKHNL